MAKKEFGTLWEGGKLAETGTNQVEHASMHAHGVGTQNTSLW